MTGQGEHDFVPKSWRRDETPDWRDAMEVFRSPDEAAHDELGSELLERLTTDHQLTRRFNELRVFDDRVEQALFAVAPPASLENRLLDAVAAAALEQVDEMCVQRAEQPTSAHSTPDKQGRKSLRRSFCWATAAALLLACGLAWWNWRSPSESWTAARFVAVSDGWIAQLQPNAWKSLRTPPAEFPLPSGLAVRFTRFQVAELDGRRVAAYRGRIGDRGAEVFLFVLRPPGITDLPPSPPPRPQTATSGWLVGSWRSDSLVYVMRLHGTSLDYQRAIGFGAPLARSSLPVAPSRKVSHMRAL